MTRADRAQKVLASLRREYPEARPLLLYRSPFELLIAVILSAQTTDEQVNRATPQLFLRFPGPAELGSAPIEELESIVHGVGFFRTKARNIRATAAMVADEFGGTVPDSIDKLVRLPGVGRKSANVVVSHCYSLPGIIVDTHFSRVSRRIGLVRQTAPEKIEQEIASYVPKDSWTALSMCVNYHGRRCCTARKPACFRCVVSELCEYGSKTPAPESESSR